MAMALSGIAATNLPGGRTVHYKLKVPIKIEEKTVIDKMTKKGAMKELIQKTRLMVIDEMTMANRKMMNCIDRSLQEALNNDKPFGGITVVLVGDWRQTLPIVQKGSKAQILYETLKHSQIWEHVQCLELKQNMRLKSLSSVDAEKVREFSEYLLSIGEGREKTYPEIGEDMIMIPETLKSDAMKNEKTLEQFCYEIFDNIKTIVENGLKSSDSSWTEYFTKRVIIAPTNVEANEINHILHKVFPGQETVYRSYDTVRNTDKPQLYPLEFLNTIQVSSIPPHIIRLKIGSPFMLIRTLDPSQGHINGTRYITKNITTRVIHGEIITGEFKGNNIFIPRILFHPEDKTIPFEFERKQFPIRGCFGMTSNKSQGQSFEKVGIYLKKDFFGHGQLYVAMSRVTHPDALKFFKPKSTGSKCDGYTKNVVFKEVLSKNDDVNKSVNTAAANWRNAETFFDEFWQGNEKELEKVCDAASQWQRMGATFDNPSEVDEEAFKEWENAGQAFINFFNEPEEEFLEEFTPRNEQSVLLRDQEDPTRLIHIDEWISLDLEQKTQEDSVPCQVNILIHCIFECVFKIFILITDKFRTRDSRRTGTMSDIILHCSRIS